MLTGFSHVMLYVNDLDRAAKFYAATFGFKVNFLAAPHYGSLFHDAMQFRLDLHPARGKGTSVIGGSPLVYFTCDDIDRTVSDLRGKGITVEDPRSEGGSPRFSSFRDSEGNELGLTEAPARRS